MTSEIKYDLIQKAADDYLVFANQQKEINKVIAERDQSVLEYSARKDVLIADTRNIVLKNEKTLKDLRKEGAQRASMKALIAAEEEDLKAFNAYISQETTRFQTAWNLRFNEDHRKMLATYWNALRSKMEPGHYVWYRTHDSIKYVLCKVNQVSRSDYPNTAIKLEIQQDGKSTEPSSFGTYSSSMTQKDFRIIPSGLTDETIKDEKQVKSEQNLILTMFERDSYVFFLNS